MFVSNGKVIVSTKQVDVPILAAHHVPPCIGCAVPELKRCSGCRAVYYCTRRGMDGKAVCQHKAWSGHKKACKKATRARKRREAAA